MTRKGIFVAVLGTFVFGSCMTSLLAAAQSQTTETKDKLVLLGGRIRSIERILGRVEASTECLRNSPNVFPFHEFDCGGGNKRIAPTEEELSERLSSVFQRLTKMEDQNLRYLRQIGRIPGSGGIDAPIPDPN